MACASPEATAHMMATNHHPQCPKGWPREARDLIAALETAFGRTAAIERLPEQPGDVPVTYADISKAERLFGYRPRTEIADGLRAFRTWLETHRGVLMG
jgi:nucleoside-diphosphate-sugar epimerase